MRRTLAVVMVLAGCGGDGTQHFDVTCTPSTIYLDRFGGTYTHGAVDDATTNISVVVDQTRTLAPWNGDDVSWTDLTACIREGLAPFQVTVTETDPGTTPHLELVFTDTYWGGAGVTHLVPGTCRPGHQIELIFHDALATPTRGCEIALDGLAEMVAQLGPSQDCLDFTSPAGDCGVRSFLATDLACVDPATDLPAACRCGTATTQNSFAALDALFQPCR